MSAGSLTITADVLRNYSKFLDFIKGYISAVISYSSSEVVAYNKSHILKCVGLVIADGNFSKVVRGCRTISFGGLSEYTFYAITRSFLELGCSVLFELENGHYRIRIARNFASRNVVNAVRSIARIEHLEDMLSELTTDELASFLAGVIDGDGYVGKSGKYVAISFNRHTLKGSIIWTFLRHLDNQGLIEVKSYRGRPHYECVIRFTDLNFLSLIASRTYHPRRAERLGRLYRSLVRSYVCGFSSEELVIILMNARNVYIEDRPGRGNVLVVDVEVGGDVANIFSSERIHRPKPIVRGRILRVKIGKKCKSELQKALNIIRHIHRDLNIPWNIIEKFLST